MLFPHLGYWYSTAINIGVHICFQFPVCFSWVNAQSATVGSYGSSILNFLKTLHIVMVAPIYVLTNSAQKFPFLQPCQHLLFLVFLILDILMCEVIFHIVLFAFPWRLVMLSIFSCVCWPSVYLLWENVCSDIFPSCSWIILQLSCVNFKEFILDINFLSDIWFANILSLSVGWLFILLIPFLCKSFLVWCSAILKYSLILPLLLESDPTKPLSRPMSRSLPPVFSSMSFMVSSF